MSQNVIALANSPDKFLEFIYRDESGLCYIATKMPPQAGNLKEVQQSWTQRFFEWPNEKAAITQFIKEASQTNEVFFSPALFKENNSQKASVKGARVFWCEFDGEVPSDLNGFPPPSLRVQSSLEGREHWYWATETLIEPYDLEKVNRGITYKFGADASGWDANQVLRPVGTKNHKRDAKVVLLELNKSTYTLNQFNDLPEPPPSIDAPVPEHLPPIEDIISQYPFPANVWVLFKEGMPEGKRSEGLMALGYYLAELQLRDEEVFALLLNADERWGKFAGRTDQYKRLMEIVVRARSKYPMVGKNGEAITSLASMGFSTLLKTKVSLEWVWEGYLQKKGYLLLTGPSGVGKTQFSLDAAAQLALGRDFLGRPVKEPRKIGFFSLEMGIEDLKFFMEAQAQSYSAEELEVLEKNLRIFPLGEPLYLSSKDEKARVQEVIEREGFGGVVFDSLGSTSEDSLSEEKAAKNLMDWNDRLRQRYDIFTWFIHHHRKATSDNKRPNKLSDVYGSHYFTARATTVLALWPTTMSSTLQLLSLKVRLAAKPDVLNLYRDSKLRFIGKKSGISIPDIQPEDGINEEVDEEDKTNMAASEETMGI